AISPRLAIRTEENMDMRYHPGDEEYTSPGVFHRPAFTPRREHGAIAIRLPPRAVAVDLSFRASAGPSPGRSFIVVSSPTDAAPHHRSAIRRRRSALPAAD